MARDGRGSFVGAIIVPFNESMRVDRIEDKVMLLGLELVASFLLLSDSYIVAQFSTRCDLSMVGNVSRIIGEACFQNCWGLFKIDRK